VDEPPELVRAAHQVPQGAPYVPYALRQRGRLCLVAVEDSDLVALLDESTYHVQADEARHADHQYVHFLYSSPAKTATSRGLSGSRCGVPSVTRRTNPAPTNRGR